MEENVVDFGVCDSPCLADDDRSSGGAVPSTRVGTLGLVESATGSSEIFEV